MERVLPLGPGCWPYLNIGKDQFTHSPVILLVAYSIEMRRVTSSLQLGSLMPSAPEQNGETDERYRKDTFAY